MSLLRPLRDTSAASWALAREQVATPGRWSRSVSHVAEAFLNRPPEQARPGG